MDQHHHQPQLTHDGSPQVFVDTGYAPYTSWEDDTTGYLMYPHLQQTDELRVLNNTNTPSWQDRHQALEYHCSIHMMPPDERDLGSGVYTSSSPRGLIPLSTTPPPQSLNMCDPLSSQNSGSGTSAHGIYHSKGSDTTNSPASFRGTSLPQLYPLHFDNTPSPSSSVRRRTGGYSTFNHDGNSTSNSFAEEVAKKKKEATRKLKAGDEQRRRDSLREAYSRLRVVLGVSDLIIISETSLLERAKNHIDTVEKEISQLQRHLAESKAETARIRTLNEQLNLPFGGNDAPSSEQVSLDSYPWLLPVDVTQPQLSDIGELLAESRPWVGHGH